MPPTEIVQTADEKNAFTDLLRLTSRTTGTAGKGGQMSAKSGIEAFDVGGVDGGANALRNIE